MKPTYKRSVPKILTGEKHKLANLAHATLTAIFAKAKKRKTVFAEYFSQHQPAFRPALGPPTIYFSLV
jgi:hypothetical protein